MLHQYILKLLPEHQNSAFALMNGNIRGVMLCLSTPSYDFLILAEGDYPDKKDFILWVLLLHFVEARGMLDSHKNT